MSEGKFQDRYRIPSARAAWHDYNGGIYFITICTHGREHYFGEIRYDSNGDAKMFLSEIGEFTNDCILKMESLHNGITLPVWVIMPDHIHLLVDVAPPVETPYYDVSTILPDVQPDGETPCYDVSTMISNKNENMQSLSNRCGRLSHIISRFKTIVTKYAHENGIPFAWQTRFYDRIVRDGAELNHIAAYIENNVGQWMAGDGDNPL